MIAADARKTADRINAPDPEKALNKALKVVISASKKGLYSDWVLLREVDTQSAVQCLEALGYLVEITKADQQDENLLIKISWGLA